MIQYSVQCNDFRQGWTFQKRHVTYETKELAQKYIDDSIRMWKERKGSTIFLPIDVERLSKPEYWRIVQREVSEWTVSE